jgi:acetate kinase
MCRKCLAIYADKRWRFDTVEAPKLVASPRTQRLVCPACRKVRNDHPEGLATVTRSDLRDHEAEIRGLIANVEAGAGFTFEILGYRVREYIGSYVAASGGAVGVIFGGGIGEHAPDIRASICEGMDWCGLVFDRDLNGKTVALPMGRAASIRRDDARVEAYAMAADEEIWIAREIARCLNPKEGAQR